MTLLTWLSFLRVQDLHCVKAAHKMLVKLRPVVNFINVFCTRFLYERRFGSFFLVMFGLVPKFCTKKCAKNVDEIETRRAYFNGSRNGMCQIRFDKDLTWTLMWTGFFSDLTLTMIISSRSVLEMQKMKVNLKSNFKIFIFSVQFEASDH